MDNLPTIDYPRPKARYIHVMTVQWLLMEVAKEILNYPRTQYRETYTFNNRVLTVTCSQFCIKNTSVWSKMTISRDDKKSKLAPFLLHSQKCNIWLTPFYCSQMLANLPDSVASLRPNGEATIMSEENRSEKSLTDFLPMATPILKQSSVFPSNIDL